MHAASGPHAPTEGAFTKGGVVGYNLPSVRVIEHAARARRRDGARHRRDRVRLRRGDHRGRRGAGHRRPHPGASTADADDALVVVVRYRPRREPGPDAVRVAGDADVAAAARAARDARRACGLTGVEAQHVATAVSEIARNAVQVRRRRRGGAGAGRARRAVAACASRCATAARASPTSAAALRDGMSTGGSLGLGLPGARRLMDDFAIRSGPGGTEVRDGALGGRRRARQVPARARSREGHGGVALAQPFRNGVLLGVAAGPRADDVARGWRTRPGTRRRSSPRRPARRWTRASGSASRSRAVSALDGRLAWLRAGAVGCVLLRGDGEVVLFPPAGRPRCAAAAAGRCARRRSTCAATTCSCSRPRRSTRPRWPALAGAAARAARPRTWPRASRAGRWSRGGRRPGGRPAAATERRGRDGRLQWKDHEDRHPSRVRRGPRALHVRQRVHDALDHAEIRVEICSNCHPFYTGKQKLVDTGGRVERFKRRAAKRAQ